MRHLVTDSAIRPRGRWRVSGGGRAATGGDWKTLSSWVVRSAGQLASCQRPAAGELVSTGRGWRGGWVVDWMCLVVVCTGLAQRYTLQPRITVLLRQPRPQKQTTRYGRRVASLRAFAVHFKKHLCLKMSDRACQSAGLLDWWEWLAFRPNVYQPSTGWLRSFMTLIVISFTN